MPRLGDVLASKYRLELLLGSGGMGHVYRATNEDIGRAVAIKVLRTEHATNPSYVDRFLREARAANLVRHPNVVDVLDIGRDADGSPFLVQELLHGQDLLTYVQASGGQLGFGDVVTYVLPVIEAVALAHKQGVVHRDIKPENVFLAQVDGKVVPKLLDFGISRITSSIRTTDAGTMMGTPAYMAPEMIQGGDADARSDVWALGVMLFELLAGRYPFQERDAPALFVLVVTKDMPALVDVMPDVHEGISRIIGRCLRRDATARYATAAELARDLRSLAKGGEIEPTLPSIPIAASSLAVPDLALPEAPQLVIPPPRISAAPARAEVVELPPSMELDRREPAISSHPPSSSRIPVARNSPSPAAMYAPPPPPRQGADEMAAVTGLAVVGLVAILTTAVLTTFVRHPEGLCLLGFFMKPEPLLNTAVQAAAGLLALFIGYRLAVGGFHSWKILGGKGSSVFQAAFGGGFLFLAIELARAAL